MELTGFVGKERTGEDLSMESDAALLSLTTGFSMVPAGKEEPVTLPFPAVLFMATSLDEVVRGEISFTVMEGLFPGFAVAVCVSADTGRRGDTVVEIGRASCRERVEISVGAVSLNKRTQ